MKNKPLQKTEKKPPKPAGKNPGNSGDKQNTGEPGDAE
jgi:hypothetical protein